MTKKNFLELLTSNEEVEEKKKLECVQYYLDNYISMIIGSNNIPILIIAIINNENDVSLLNYSFNSLKRRYRDFE